MKSRKNLTTHLARLTADSVRARGARQTGAIRRALSQLTDQELDTLAELAGKPIDEEALTAAQRATIERLGTLLEA